MTQGMINALAAAGVAGQALLALAALGGLAALVGVQAPLRAMRSALSGYELWAAFAVSAIATGGSLFFSEIAGFVPCELCWFQRICMYPLAILTLLAAVRDDYGLARYLLPLPVVGASVAGYQLLIENGLVREPSACRVGGAGCAAKWIDKFGYMTIPTLSLTAFGLLIALLALAAADDGHAPQAHLARA
jgi:disulfide bond formation protein DsbB